MGLKTKKRKTVNVAEKLGKILAMKWLLWFKGIVQPRKLASISALMDYSF